VRYEVDGGLEIVEVKLPAVVRICGLNEPPAA
jgi:electron transfer flavoprotein alpha/beta subunit